MLPEVRRALRSADVGMVTSYCPDSRDASAALLDSTATAKVFYDLDTPVTLARLRAGEMVGLHPGGGLGAFDMVLSYTGGRALDELRSSLGARSVAPLYGCVDPDLHRPVTPNPRLECDLSYLGTYAADRQDAFERLFIAPARAVLPDGSRSRGRMYPADFKWTAEHVLSVAPAARRSPGLLLLLGADAQHHPRRRWRRWGSARPGGCSRQRRAAPPVVSDWWEGLDAFFTPGEEILIAKDTADAVAALDSRRINEAAIGRRARERALDCHTAAIRAGELERSIASRSAASVFPAE